MQYAARGVYCRVPPLAVSPMPACSSSRSACRQQGPPKMHGVPQEAIEGQMALPSRPGCLVLGFGS